MVKKIVGSKYFNSILFFVFLIIPFLLHLDLFSNNMALSGGDGVQFFSREKFLSESLLNGEFPLWNKYLSVGIPYIAYTGFYPLSIILGFLPMKLFMYAYYSLHLAMGAVFFYLFLREIKCNQISSISVALIYELSIQLGGLRKGHMSIITVVIYLPIILYLLQRYINTKSFKWLLISSIAMSMQFFSGIQHTLYTDIIAFFYLFAVGIHVNIGYRKLIKHSIYWILSYFGIIMIQLLPTLELLLEYSKNGSSSISFEYFKSYSIHFIKLLQMLFPNIFGNDVYQNFGPYFSSEMDIEIFLGAIVFVLIIHSIYKYFKDFRVRFSFYIMVCSFIYCSIGHIPILREIVYHIPIIGGFRCPSRALFIFAFFGYVLVAISISNMENNEEMIGFFEFIKKFTIGIFTLISITAFVLIVYAMSNGIMSDEIKIYYSYGKKAFISTLSALCITTYICKLIIVSKNKLEKHKYNFAYLSFVFFFTIITFCETNSFREQSQPVSLDVFTLKDESSAKIFNDIGYYKIWEALPIIDGSHESIISQNKSVLKEIPSVNSYIAYNNPRLYKLFTNGDNAPINYAGLLTGSIYAEKNLLFNNDLLSMMGVKYIIDSSNLIKENGEIVKILDKKDTIVNNFEINVPNSNGELYVYSQPIKIKSNTIYKLEFTAKTDIESINFALDFYGGDTYDSQAQEISFKIIPEKSHYIAYLNSEDISKASSEIVIRILARTSGDIILKDLTLDEMNIEYTPSIYIPYMVSDNNRIFENINAKDILYVPQNVKSIENVDDIYDNINNYDLLNNSYIEQFKNINLDNKNTGIEIQSFSNNKINAIITSDKPTFVNFSQCYYPGWKAYINGKNTPIYMVNGLIQGIEVPGGKNLIEFKYTSLSLMVGGIVSLLIVTVIIIYIIKLTVKKNYNG